MRAQLLHTALQMLYCIADAVPSGPRCFVDLSMTAACGCALTQGSTTLSLCSSFAADQTACFYERIVYTQPERQRPNGIERAADDEQVFYGRENAACAYSSSCIVRQAFLDYSTLANRHPFRGISIGGCMHWNQMDNVSQSSLERRLRADGQLSDIGN